MRYFYQDQNYEWIGPYTMEELRQLHLNGIIKPDTTTMDELEAARIRAEGLG